MPGFQVSPQSLPEDVRSLDVVPEAISVPDTDTHLGLMHTLFALEDNYGLTVTVLDGQVCLKQDLNHPKYNTTLAEDLASWNEIKTKLTTGSITRETYDLALYSPNSQFC